MSYQDLPQNYDDPHRRDDRVHYRLYQSRTGPTVICVQDFDYIDYDGTKFLSPEAWYVEAEAEEALRRSQGSRPALAMRVLVTEDLRVGDVADIVYDTTTGTMTAVRYRQPID